MLETIRTYALEQLSASEERAATQRRHLLLFLALVEAAEPEIQGPDQAAWLDQLAREHDNLRAALQWALDNQATDAALRLAAALGEFWWPRGYVKEGQHWLAKALEHGVSATAAYAKALYRAGELAYAEYDAPQATALLEEGLALYQELGDRWGLARVLRGLGNVQTLCGNAEQVQAFYDQSMALFREINDTWGIAWMLVEIGRAQRDPLVTRATPEGKPGAGAIQGLQTNHCNGAGQPGQAGPGAAQLCAGAPVPRRNAGDRA